MNVHSLASTSAGNLDKLMVDMLTPIDDNRKRWIYIDVEEARSLRSDDVTGWADPYCQIYLGSKKIGKTRHIPRTLNPQWFQRFRWSGVINWKHNAYLRFEVRDRDAMNKDDSMGAVEVALCYLRDKSWELKWYPLYRGDDLTVRASGYLRLRIQIVDKESDAFLEKYRKEEPEEEKAEEAAGDA